MTFSPLWEWCVPCKCHSVAIMSVFMSPGHRQTKLPTCRGGNGVSILLSVTPSLQFLFVCLYMSPGHRPPYCRCGAISTTIKTRLSVREVLWCCHVSLCHRYAHVIFSMSIRNPRQPPPPPPPPQRRRTVCQTHAAHILHYLWGRFSVIRSRLTRVHVCPFWKWIYM